MPEVEIRVSVVNLTYTVRGWKALQELKDWLDQNGECDYGQPSLVDTTVREVPTASPGLDIPF